MKIVWSICTIERAKLGLKQIVSNHPQLFDVVEMEGVILC